PNRGLHAARDGSKRRVVEGDLPPAEYALTVVHDGRLEDRLVVPATRRVARQKAHGDAIVARRRKLDAVLGELGCVELVGDLQGDARAVAGARIAAGCSAVRQVAEDLEALCDDLVGRLTLDGGHKSEPAGIVFERRIVQPLAPR